MQYQPTELANHPEVLLRIHVFADSTWDRLPHRPGDPLGGVVARARGRTYLAASAQRNPYADGSTDARMFEAMRLSLADVKRWLSVADAASDMASEFLPGSPTFGPAPVLYTGTARSSAEATPRAVKVIFRRDSTALVSTETGRGSEVNNERGRWSLEGVYLRLVLLQANGQPTGETFLWAIQDSALAPVTWDRERYGTGGLILQQRR